MEKEIEKCCGNCCWFYAEDTDGWGICALRKGELDSINCTDMCIDDFVSRQEMRHHMAVLLQRVRVQEDNNGYSFHPKRKWPFGVIDAMKFAYKYMKVFSNL